MKEKQDRMMTEKQEGRVMAIIAYFGWTRVQEYVTRFYPDADPGRLTKEQAQKIITGLTMRIPVKHVTGVYGRDAA